MNFNHRFSPCTTSTHASHPVTSMKITWHATRFYSLSSALWGEEGRLARAVCSHYLSGREHKADVIGHLMEVKACFCAASCAAGTPPAPSWPLLWADWCRKAPEGRVRGGVVGQNGWMKGRRGDERGYRVVVTGELMRRTLISWYSLQRDNLLK